MTVGIAVLCAASTPACAATNAPGIPCVRTVADIAHEEAWGAFSPSNVWTFKYSYNRFDDGALVDMRFLNEKVAGMHGFVRISADGNGFLTGDGKPLRFWAVVLGLGTGKSWSPLPTDTSIAQQARWLAKMGVNAIRFHIDVPSKAPGSKLTDVDEKLFDSVRRVLAGYKKEGIYSILCPYWPGYTKADMRQWGIEGFETNKPPDFGVLFYNERLQQGYKAWMRTLLTETNVYTGIPLKDDPALAIIQVMNEDSMLFATVDRCPMAQKKLRATLFTRWVAAKYGSSEKAFAAWKQKPQPADAGPGRQGKPKPGFEVADDIPAGTIGLLSFYLLNKGATNLRARDQYLFCLETQRGFYKAMRDYFRNELGCKQFVNASNWKTFDEPLMQDGERYTYTGTDVLAVNRYFGDRIHLPIDKRKGMYMVQVGDRFGFFPAPFFPTRLPCTLKHVEGHPFILTETCPQAPTPYQSDGAFLLATYGAMSGLDGVFCLAVTEYEPEYKLDDGTPQSKGLIQQPLFMGQFPAASLIYRLGYVKEADPIALESRTLDEIVAARSPAIRESGTIDFNRDEDGTPGSGQPASSEALFNAFLVGRVVTRLGAASNDFTLTADLARYDDVSNSVVSSMTGELRWDYGNGIVTLNAPKAQGATGFLNKKGVFALRDVTVKTANPHATILVVSLDDRPLTESKKILVQVGTFARWTNWNTEPCGMIEDRGRSVPGQKLVSTPAPPWLIMNTDATVAIANPKLTKATACDPMGFATTSVPLKRADGAVTVTLPPDVLYVVLE